MCQINLLFLEVIAVTVVSAANISVAVYDGAAADPAVTRISCCFRCVGERYAVLLLAHTHKSIMAAPFAEGRRKRTRLSLGTGLTYAAISRRLIRRVVYGYPINYSHARGPTRLARIELTPAAVAQLFSKCNAPTVLPFCLDTSTPKDTQFSIFSSLSGGELTAAAKTGQFCIRFHNSTVSTWLTGWLTD